MSKYNTPNYGNLYAKTNHSHDDIYAKKIHEHNNLYSRLDHKHDDIYLKLTGGNVSGDISCAKIWFAGGGKGRIGYDWDTGDVFISNYADNWLRLKQDKTLTYAGKSVLLNQGKQQLWSGGLYMNADQSVTPSKPLSDCQNGWVLVWGDYDPSTSTNNNYNFVFHYVHKNSFISGANSLWMCATDGGVGKDVTKTLYITNTDIKGHVNNSSTTESKDVILRYVYEW